MEIGENGRTTGARGGENVLEMAQFCMRLKRSPPGIVGLGKHDPAIEGRPGRKGTKKAMRKGNAIGGMGRWHLSLR